MEEGGPVSIAVGFLQDVSILCLVIAFSQFFSASFAKNVPGLAMGWLVLSDLLALAADILIRDITAIVINSAVIALLLSIGWWGPRTRRTARQLGDKSRQLLEKIKEKMRELEPVPVPVRS
jgi:hypothetical protein